ncbi:hypothetical protein [Hamadaea tsunoensis]|uniref:hypothetical protein n=1 Tax=Hamadaea tsunoensis TaxID=53368 RepID=UPI00040047BC|nr:hypothetical protein [Hamadaea tsunoensis]
MSVEAAARSRLLSLFLAGRRVPAALAAVAVAAITLHLALYRPWNTYGALQLPLIVEAACAAAIAGTLASPFGEPERVAGSRLPFLRSTMVVGLTAAAACALAVATVGVPLSGGVAALVRNLVGFVGLGLLCAAAVGGGLAWTGPVTYLILGVYALYTQWHGPALTTPWVWPGRPGHDPGAALCAGVVFAIGLAVYTWRGARE